MKFVAYYIGTTMYNVMFRDKDILPDNTYIHAINNGSQSCSWLDHIAMSDVLSESTVDCCTLLDVVCSDHCAITVTLNFDQLPMIHYIERQNDIIYLFKWDSREPLLKRRSQKKFSYIPIHYTCMYCTVHIFLVQTRKLQPLPFSFGNCISFQYCSV